MSLRSARCRREEREAEQRAGGGDGKREAVLISPHKCLRITSDADAYVCLRVTSDADANEPLPDPRNQPQVESHPWDGSCQCLPETGIEVQVPGFCAFSPSVPPF